MDLIDSKYIVRYLDESEYDRWDKFVGESDQDNLFSKSCWLSAISKAVFAECRIVSVSSGEELKAGVAIFILKKSFVEIIRQPVLTPHTSIILPPENGRQPSKVITENLDMMTLLASFLEKEKFAYVSIVNMPTVKDMRSFMRRGWRVTPQYTYLLDLTDLDKLRNSFSKSLRRRIQKCETGGFNSYSEDNIEKFLSLYELTYKRQMINLPIETDRLRELYIEIKKHNSVKLFFVEIEDGTVASAEMIVYSNKLMTHNLAAGADPAHYKTGAVSYLLWYIFKELNAEGVKCYDFVGANIDKIEDFKRSFGGELTPYFSVARANSKLLRLVKLIKDFSQS